MKQLGGLVVRQQDEGCGRGGRRLYADTTATENIDVFDLTSKLFFHVLLVIVHNILNALN